MNNIIVTGGSGLLGKSLNKICPNFIYASSKDVDLTDRVSTFKYLKKLNPDAIIHLAGKVGGIKENSESPYDFININNLINTNVINYAVSKNIYIIFSSSTCVYPKKSDHYPMTEEMVNDGEPEITNDSYAYAKRFSNQMLRAAHRQYGTQYCTLYLCNLYGENDNFENVNKSHLVTALIHKFHQAKINKSSTVELWGTGNPLRQFMHAYDAATIIKKSLDIKLIGEYNVAIDKNLTIREIAETIKKIVGYNGEIIYNGKLDGVYRKDVSSDKIFKYLDKYNFIEISEGASKTYQSYLENNKCGN